MRSIFFCFIALFFLIACNSSSENAETVKTEETAQPANKETVIQKQAEEQAQEASKKDIGKIGKVKPGMSEEEVIKIMGEPTGVKTLNPDEKAKSEDWFYGDNQKVRMIKGIVNRVSHDIKGEQAIIKELVEAKEAGDTEKERELIEKLKNGDY